jgi:hypothetical protein
MSLSAVAAQWQSREFSSGDFRTLPNRLAVQDYTLIHYDVNAWEGKAYEYGLQWLREAGCPVEGLKFDPDLVIRGLIVDKELGNLVKVDRFG